MRALQRKDISSVELTEHYLRRLTRHNASLNAFLSLSDTILEQAKAVDARRTRGEEHRPLAGAPIAVKDLLDTAHLYTTYGGKHYVNHLPRATATAVSRLEQAGAIVLGKTNLHEYAYGTTTENPHFGNARNPWNTSKIAGGSSGGSSVALAAGLSVAALGTDTGGSIRIPAALCGHVGFKPTHGLVSTYGVFPLAPSLDHVGPMTRSVADARLMMALLAGPDPNDANTLHRPVRTFERGRTPTPVRLGVPTGFFFERCHPSVLQVMHAALQKLRDNGVLFEEVDIPMMSDVPEMQRRTIASEAAAVHASLLAAHPEVYGEDVRRRLEAGADVTGAQYIEAQRLRRDFVQSLTTVFDRVQAVVTPTVGLPATDIGQWKAHVKSLEVNVRAHLTRLTNPWNLSGLPAITLPCGTTIDGLPVGLQLVGWRNTDARLLDIAESIEDVLGKSTLAPAYR